MSELTDDQLDGLFRKSAEEFDPPFDPAAWQDMKARLDTNDRPSAGGTPPWKNILRWVAPLGLLLLLVGGWYMYSTSTSGRSSSSASTNKLSPVQTIPQSIKTTSDSRQRSVEPQAAKADAREGTSVHPSVQPVEKNDQSAVLKKPVTNAGPDNLSISAEADKRSRNGASGVKAPSIAQATDGEKEAYRKRIALSDAESIANHTEPAASPNLTVPITKAFSVSKSSVGRVTTERFKTGKEKKTRSISNAGAMMAMDYATPLRSLSEKKTVGNVSEAGGPATKDVANGVPVTDLGETQRVSLPDISELAIHPAHWPKALLFTGRDVAAQPDTTAQQMKPAIPVQRGLSIRFAIAPDLSSVGLKNFSRPGTNVGVLLEYRLASRWSVQAGVIQSTKIYEAYSSDYTVPAGSYVETVRSKLGSIDGRCNMFDIPINLRYDFLLRPRESGLSPSRWFVNGGVTSYYIKKEDYYYNYTGYVHNAVSEWSTKTGGYGFSQLNFSVGYERAITKRLSWQIEPFIKAPLKGVGFFKIDLLSTGTFFSIRYKL